MGVKHSELEPMVVTEESSHTETFQYPIADLIAHGRVFIQNQNGDMEQVVLMSWWKQDELLTVCKDGYEFDEDGTETRRWKAVTP